MTKLSSSKITVILLFVVVLFLIGVNASCVSKNFKNYPVTQVEQRRSVKTVSDDFDELTIFGFQISDKKSDQEIVNLIIDRYKDSDAEVVSVNISRDVVSIFFLIKIEAVQALTLYRE